MQERYLSIYLNDHLAGSVVGQELAKRCLSGSEGSALEAYLRDFIAQITEDRRHLESIMSRLGISKSPVKRRAAWAAEKVGRLKSNGHVLRPSPLSRVVELEGLITGVQGKLSLWENLDAVDPGGEAAWGVDLAALIERAHAQLDKLRELRIDAAKQALAG